MCPPVTGTKVSLNWRVEIQTPREENVLMSVKIARKSCPVVGGIMSEVTVIFNDVCRDVNVSKDYNTGIRSPVIFAIR